MDKLKKILIKQIKKSGYMVEFDNTFPLIFCSGVSDIRPVFNFKKFNINTKTLNIEEMGFLLGYKKIVWCQYCNTPLIKKLKNIILEYDQFHHEYEDNYTDINLKNRLLDLFYDTSFDKYKQIMKDFPKNIYMKECGDDVFFYYSEFEDTVNKLIEIINFKYKHGDKNNFRNEVAIGLMLGYSAKNVKEWTDRYKTKNKMWGQILNIKSTKINDIKINNFIKKITKHKNINNGLLSGVEIPTATKYKLDD